MVDATSKYGQSAAVTHLGEVPTARHHVKPELGHEGPRHLLISSPLEAKKETRDMTIPLLPWGVLWKPREALRPDLSVPFSTSRPLPETDKAPGLRTLSGPRTEPASSESTIQDTHCFPGEASEEQQQPCVPIRRESTP